MKGAHLSFPVCTPMSSTHTRRTYMYIWYNAYTGAVPLDVSYSWKKTYGVLLVYKQDHRIVYDPCIRQIYGRCIFHTTQLFCFSMMHCRYKECHECRLIEKWDKINFLYQYIYMGQMKYESIPVCIFPHPIAFIITYFGANTSLIFLQFLTEISYLEVLASWPEDHWCCNW